MITLAMETAMRATDGLCSLDWHLAVVPDPLTGDPVVLVAIMPPVRPA